MFELNSHMEEADEKIIIDLHVANSLKYNIDRVIVHSPDRDLGQWLEHGAYISGSRGVGGFWGSGPPAHPQQLCNCCCSLIIAWCMFSGKYRVCPLSTLGHRCFDAVALDKALHPQVLHFTYNEYLVGQRLQCV